MGLRISVLIPTLGREKEVIETVQGLLAQTRVPDEILVVDQNQPPLAEMDAFLAGVPLVRHIRSNRTGVVFHMNVLLREAKGEVVLFVDDDVLPSPSLVEAHLANYEGRSPEDFGGVAGRVEQPKGDLPPSKIERIGHYERWSGSVTSNFNARERRDVMIAQGANMSFWRSLLIGVGGFDLGFEGNGYFFESDASLRVLKAGHRIIFDPTAELIHLAAPAGGARISDKSLHTFYFVKNGVRLYRRHSPLIGLPFFVTKMAGYVLAKAAFNRDLKILTRGLRALLEGGTQSGKMVSNL